VPYCYIEHAKLLWSQGEFHEALLKIQDELKKADVLIKLSSSAIDSVPSEEQDVQAEGDLLTAKTLLLLGRWMQHAGQAHYKEVISQFEKVIRLQPRFIIILYTRLIYNRWEKGFFFLARYYDMLYVSPSIQDQQEKVHNAKNPVREVKDREFESLEYLSKAIYHYGQSLVWGHNYIFQSLPRILTLWFDFSATCTGNDKKSPRIMEFQKITKTMGKLINRLPSYQWYICYLQLISRICHPSKDVHELLQQILVKVLKEYPRQALWPLMAITKSLNPVRATRANSVINKAKQVGAPVELLDQGETFCTHLLDLCNYNVPKQSVTLSLQTAFSNFKRFVKKPLDLIIPLQSSLSATLPADGKTNALHNAFPTNQITVLAMKDEIEIMSSMQRPRKIGMKVRQEMPTCIN
jgi:serine/threonine-protein kinase ATR